MATLSEIPGPAALKPVGRLEALALHGPRVTLRLPLMSDAPDLALALADYGVVKNLSQVPHPYQLQDAAIWLSRQIPEQNPRLSYSFAIVTGGRLVGVVGVTARPAGVELGYWLARSAWGQGF